MESLLVKIEIKIWPKHTDFIVEIWFLSVTVTMVALVTTAKDLCYSLIQSTVVAWAVAEFCFIFFDFLNETDD